MKDRRDSAVCRRPARGVRSLLREIPGGQTLLSTAADWQGQSGRPIATVFAGTARRPSSSPVTGCRPGGRFAAWTSARWVCVFAPVRGHRILIPLQARSREAPFDGPDKNEFNPIHRNVKIKFLIQWTTETGAV